jgi:hypothetical protein
VADYHWPEFPQNSSEEEEDVAETLRDFAQMINWRNNYGQQCEEVARLIDPESRNTFMYGSYNFPGSKKTHEQIDSTGMVALDRFVSICDSLLTPRNNTWHTLEADDPNVMKDRATRLWFEDTTRRLFRLRYAPSANFAANQQGCYRTLGAYGTPCMFIDALDTSIFGGRGLRYRSVPLGELFIKENHQGIVDYVIRWFRLTARQAYQKWGNKIHPLMRSALEQGNEMPFEFLHRVCPRDDYDPDRIDHKGKAYASYYVSVQGRCIMEEGGYRTFPFAVSRYLQTPGEVYGRSPAMRVLPALKTLNAQKTTFLKQGHRAADPVLLTTDDGIVGISLRPGAINAGGMSADGKRLIDVLPTGDIQISEKMMEMEIAPVEDVFLTSLFKLILDENIQTATQVMEIVNQKGILIAPTMGRQQSELLGSEIDRELDIASDLGLLAPMPPALREARGSYQVKYTSPLSRAARAQEVAGFMRTVDWAKDIVGITQDVSLMDRFDFDVALPNIADIQGVQESWMADDRKVAAKAKQRAQAAQREQVVKEAPGRAALMNAQAHQAKAGMMQPQQQQPQAAQ